MGKSAFDRAYEIITLVGGAITLGCLMGINKKQKEENANKANAAENADTNNTESNK